MFNETPTRPKQSQKKQDRLRLRTRNQSIIFKFGLYFLASLILLVFLAGSFLMFQKNSNNYIEKGKACVSEFEINPLRMDYELEFEYRSHYTQTELSIFLRDMNHGHPPRAYHLGAIISHKIWRLDEVVYEYVNFGSHTICGGQIYPKWEDSYQVSFNFTK